jgi:hypothetical protein
MYLVALLFIFYRWFNEDSQPNFATSFLITEFELIELAHHGTEYLLNKLFLIFFIDVFFWIDSSQPIWPVTRSFNQVGFQNYVFKVKYLKS